MNLLYKLTHMDPVKAVKMLLHYELVSAVVYRSFHPDSTLMTDTKRPFTILKSPRNYWLSDPVLCTHEGRSFLFMEAFDKPAYVGEIACVELKGTDTPLPRVIIREPFHMSFPRVFSWNDRFYMLPECSEDHSIRLYEATDFPYGWNCVKRFGTDAGYVDTIILNTTPKAVTILTCEISPTVQYACRYQKFMIRRDNDDYALTPDEDFNRLQRFSYQARNAGALFVKDGQTLLPAQESTEIAYGVNLNFYPYAEDSTDLTQNAVRHITPCDIRVDGLTGIQGTHSYCVNDSYEVVDALYLEWSPFKYIRRFKRRRNRRKHQEQNR